jgi:hypothetical protein
MSALVLVLGVRPQAEAWASAAAQVAAAPVAQSEFLRTVVLTFVEGKAEVMSQ